MFSYAQRRERDMMLDVRISSMKRCHWRQYTDFKLDNEEWNIVKWLQDNTDFLDYDKLTVTTLFFSKESRVSSHQVWRLLKNAGSSILWRAPVKFFLARSWQVVVCSFPPWTVDKPVLLITVRLVVPADYPVVIGVRASIAVEVVILSGVSVVISISSSALSLDRLYMPTLPSATSSVITWRTPVMSVAAMLVSVIAMPLTAAMVSVSLCIQLVYPRFAVIAIRSCFPLTIRLEKRPSCAGSRLFSLIVHFLLIFNALELEKFVSESSKLCKDSTCPVWLVAKR